ncbi:MAG TPA: hypothetical protein VMG98_10680 [Verrucomicrobiae bacterium]|nr:hypothetical protein [Verrucomicrobiae bacterium]
MPDPKQSENIEWGDARTVITTGTSDPIAAAWYLTSNRIWPLIAHPVRGPFLLGIVLFLLIVAMVLFSPSTESHFIYTDF